MTQAMTRLQVVSVSALLALLCALGGLVAGYVVGRLQGAQAEAGKRDTQALQQLQGLMDSQADLVQRANAASQGLRRALSQRAAADAQTTEEFRDALARSAASRAGCVFSDDVVRGLGTARDRAAQAAAHGLGATMPAAAPSAEQRGGPGG